MNDLHIAWAELFLSSLAHAGVRDVVVSPGSRSTPLALSAHGSSTLRSHFVVDERTAGFFALGQARVTGLPTALICTSGTAAAHYYPAVIEAAASGVPMIVITADRPWELQLAGAPQTIDQTRLFGTFVRLFLTLGVPDPSDLSLGAVARMAAQAVDMATGDVPGPVHVNAPFRKPLEPSSERASVGGAAEKHKARAPWLSTWERLMKNGGPRVFRGAPTVDGATLEPVLAACRTARRGMIVCGPGRSSGDLKTLRKEVFALAQATNFPIFAEATSQLRFAMGSGKKPDGADLPRPAVLSTLDALCRGRFFDRGPLPEVILELGSPPTSSGYAQFIAQNPNVPRIVISPLGYMDPSSSASMVIRCDVAAFSKALRVRLMEDPTASAASLEDTTLGSFAAELLAADAKVASIIEGSLSPEPTAPLTEALTVREVVERCPPESILVVGNSSPVRDIDTYAFASSKPLRVLHQRGVSGIDGLISGASGAQSVSKSAVTLLLGDLSFLHDISGLVLAKRADHPFVIVVINNDGGRIFEQLPIGSALGSGPTFERCFATPEDIHFASAAATFGVEFAQARTLEELRAALSVAHSHQGPTLIEVIVPLHQNAEQHTSLMAHIHQTVDTTYPQA